MRWYTVANGRKRDRSGVKDSGYTHFANKIRIIISEITGYRNELSGVPGKNRCFMDSEKPFDVIVGNIANSYLRISDELDIQLLNMNDACRIIGCGCDETDLSGIFDESEKLFEVSDEPLSVTTAAALKNQVHLAERSAVKAYLAMLTAARNGGKDDASKSPEHRDKLCNISYMKNIYADEAFEMFCRLIGNPAALFASDFQTVCEDVYNGRAEFCILPVETSEEGTLTAFRKLIDKYELVVCCVCSVQGDGQITKYALLGRSGDSRQMPEPTFDERYIRLTFDSPGTGNLSALFAAANVLGLEYVKSDSMPLTWDDRRYNFCVTFRAERRKIEAFLTYLGLDFPDCAEKTVYFRI